MLALSRFQLLGCSRYSPFAHSIKVSAALVNGRTSSLNSPALPSRTNRRASASMRCALILLRLVSAKFVIWLYSCPFTQNRHSSFPRKATKKHTRKLVAGAGSLRPVQFGLGPDGGGWSLRQASAWSGIGDRARRQQVRRGELGCGGFAARRIVVSGQGLTDGLNSLGRRSSAR